MSSTTVETKKSSPEDIAYAQSQIALANKQLELLNSQGSFQTDYLNSIKPVLDQQSQLLQKQLEQQNSPEQDAINQKLLDYQGNQIDLGNQQVALTKQLLDQQNSPEQQAIQKQASEYQLSQIQVAKQQLALTQAQLDQINDPVQKQIQQRAAQIQLQQLDQAQQQLQSGYAVTPQQAALIDAGTKSALDSGNANIDQQLAQFQHQNDVASSGIDAQTTDAMRQLKENLAPSLGLRPGDTPILDRGDLVQREALRQKGLLASDYSAAQSQGLNLKSRLASDLETQNANAKLNYPLQAGQLGLAGSGQTAGLVSGAQGYPLTVTNSATQPITLGLNNSVTGNSLNTIGSATDEFQQQLAASAAANRMSLLGLSSNSVGQGMSGGNQLIGATRPNYLSVGGSTTTTKNDPMGTFSAILGGVGGLATGLGSVGLSLSDARLKQGVRTLGFDKAGHRWVSFRYTGTAPTHVGVIAQEAAKISPEAVFTDGLGLKHVNYAKLRAA